VPIGTRQKSVVDGEQPDRGYYGNGDSDLLRMPKVLVIAWALCPPLLLGRGGVVVKCPWFDVGSGVGEVEVSESGVRDPERLPFLTTSVVSHQSNNNGVA